MRCWCVPSLRPLHDIICDSINDIMMIRHVDDDHSEGRQRWADGADLLCLLCMPPFVSS